MAVQNPVILEAEEIGSPVSFIRVKWNDPGYGTADEATGFSGIHDDADASLPAWTEAIDLALAGGGDGAGNYEAMLPVPLDGTGIWWETFDGYSTGSKASGSMNYGGTIWGGPWISTDAATIVDTVAVEESNRQCSLLNNPFRREIAVGSDWTVLRIGVRLSLNYTTHINPFPTLWVGLCSGTATPAGGSATVSHFHGIRTTGDNLNSDTQGIAGKPTLRSTIVDGTETTVTHTNNVSASLYIPKTSQSVAAWAIEFTKSGTSWTMATRRINKSSETLNTAADLEDCITTVGTMPVVVGGWQSDGLSDPAMDAAMTVDEATNGALDTLCIAWEHESISLELSDVMVYKVS